MSELFDELARSLARPMPRSRAVRALGVALASIAVPSLRPQAAAAGSSSTRTTSCHNLTCKNPDFPKVCKCHEKATGSPIEPTQCNWTCCAADAECECPPGEARCKAKPCDEKCGTKCCKEGEYCASPRRGICCKKGESLCAVMGTPGTGQKGAGGRCCAKNTHCCANDKRSTCCPEADNCCAGRCCPPAKRCNTSKGTCSCPKGTDTCGRDCCKAGKNPEKCCGNHCCTSTQTCCGQKCCDKGERCCGDTCCKADETCCGSAGCCKASEVCLTTSQRTLQSGSSRSTRATVRRICCPKPRVYGKTGCCPPGTRASTPDGIHFTCCPPGNPDCCDPPCLPGTICVNGTCQKGL
jgi:hypothetical protein